MIPCIGCLSAKACGIQNRCYGDYKLQEGYLPVKKAVADAFAAAAVLHHPAADDLVVAFKADAAKPRVSLIPSAAILKLAEVMTFGAKKYASHNHRKGFEYSRLVDATMRHVLAFAEGQDNDPESGLSHLGHAMFGLAVLIDHQEHGLGTDDRWKPAA